MKAKKTIAILGLEKGKEKLFLDQLANDNRLLIISEDINDCAKASEYLSQNRSEEEVELIGCPKDACWEADIIMIWNTQQYQEEVLQKLRTVATQKTVLFITEQEQKSGDLPSFPHSKTINLVIDPLTLEAKLVGKDEESVASTYRMISKTGAFKLK